jgi:L-seryl-tRNA(Ser) seleniumtransferase
MSSYSALGIRPLINVDARLTRLGGSRMPPEVLDAMHAAADSYVDMHALQLATGKRLAHLTRNDAAYVTSGAAAGLVVSTLACMIGDDLGALAQVIEGRSPERNEIVIHRAHRIPYDPAVRLAGGRIVEIGNALQTFPWELEAALNERTALVLYVAGEHLRRGALPLDATVAIAHAAGVPVVVDAAAQLPPVEHLWHFTRNLGADLVVFSGGKDLRGPQASGLVVGRDDLIASCALHGAPHQRLGRPMKVGKEETMGLLAAVERYVALDHVARAAEFEATVAFWIDRLACVPGVTATRDFPNEAGQPVPRLRIALDGQRIETGAGDLAAELLTGDPGIAVGREGEAALLLTPDTLDGDDREVVINRVACLLQERVMAAH